MEPTVQNHYPGLIGANADPPDGNPGWTIQSPINPNFWQNPGPAYLESDTKGWTCMHGVRECWGKDDEFCGHGPDDDRFVHVEPEEVDAAVSGLLRLLDD